MRLRRPKLVAGVAVCCCVLLMDQFCKGDNQRDHDEGDPVIPIDRDLVTYTSSYPAAESPTKSNR